MARFRPFRRQDGPAAHEPDPWLDDPPPRGARGPAPDPVGWDGGWRDRAEPDPFGPSVPATRAASPALWAPRPVEPVEPGEDVRDVGDVGAPVTDPFGFPPVPGPDPAPAWAAWVPDRGPRASATPAARGIDEPDPAADSVPVPSRGPLVDRPPADGRHDLPKPAPSRPRADTRWEAADPPSGVASDEVPAGSGDPAPGRTQPAEAAPIPAEHCRTTGGDLGSDAPDPAEAAALAGAFAADYLSWDEDDPARRGSALADHLPGPGTDHALLGWSGTGRQRAEIVLPGAVRPDGDGRLLVDVRVRVTPYRRVSRSEATPEPDPRDALGTPSAAPSVTARGWRGLAARWVRLGVTVVRDGDRLVVDAREEAFEEPDGEARPPEPARPRSVRVPEDPTLDGDDVVSPGSRR